MPDSPTDSAEGCLLQQPNYLSNEDELCVAVALDNALAPAMDYIETDPGFRACEELPRLIGKTELAITHLVRLQRLLRAEAFWKLHRSAMHVLGTLSSLQDEAAYAHLMIGLQATPPRVRTGRRGRPPYALDLARLETLVNDDLPYAEIAEIMGVSIWVVWNRVCKLGLARRKFEDIDHDDLVTAIQNAYQQGSGEQGYRAVHTYLINDGIRVPRDRVQDICRMLNPEGVRQRWLEVTLRRQYRVPWINSLWHMDGHHKLNPWKFVIHGAIDGYSRKIMFLKVADNNRADTVKEAFLEATRMHGWPSRVRADHGTENARVEDLMNQHRGQYDSEGRRRCSFIAGPSTRNQRIERLWVDLGKRGIKRYRLLFIHLQATGQFNPDDELDLWCLHFVFRPILEEAVNKFVMYWNKHGIRTENNRSPNRLWRSNYEAGRRAGINLSQQLNELHEFDSAVIDEFSQSAFLEYGVDDFGVQPAEEPNAHRAVHHVEPPTLVLNFSLADTLACADFRRSLRAEIGAAEFADYPQLQTQYKHCRNLLRRFVQQHHPELM